MPGRDTAPGFLLRQPFRRCAAILAKRTQVAKAQHWVERRGDPGHSGQMRSEGRPPYHAAAAPAAEPQDLLRWRHDSEYLLWNGFSLFVLHCGKERPLRPFLTN